MSEQNPSRRALDAALEHAKTLSLVDEVSEATLDNLVLKKQVYALARALETLGQALGLKRTPELVTELEAIEASLTAQVSAFDAALTSGDLDAAAAIAHMPPLGEWETSE
jgi:hypothetical protein